MMVGKSANNDGAPPPTARYFTLTDRFYIDKEPRVRKGKRATRARHVPVLLEDWSQVNVLLNTNLTIIGRQPWLG